MRKLRALLITRDAYGGDDTFEVLEMVGYQVFTTSDPTTLAIIRDVFRPDIVITVAPLEPIFDEIYKQFVCYDTLVLGIYVNTTLIQNFTKTYHLKYSKRVILLNGIQSWDDFMSDANKLLKDVQQDVDWLNQIYGQD